MKKRYIIGLILCCLMIIPLVGCSGKKDATTATKTVPKTPLQILTDRVNASDAINYTQDQTDIALSNRITTEIAAVSQVDLSPINARLGVLEALNFSDLAGGFLESYNISGRLAAIEARLNATPTPTPVGYTPTPTPVTPTPTPTSVYGCGVNRPVAIFPSPSSMSVNISGNGSTVNFEWTACTNAVRYEFYLSKDSANMGIPRANIYPPNHAYLYPVENSSTFYYWKVVAVSPCNVTEADAWWFKTE